MLAFQNEKKEGYMLVHIYDSCKSFMHFVTNHEVKTYRHLLCVKTVTVYIHFVMLADGSQWNEQQYNYTGQNIMALQQLIQRNKYQTY
jgi:hypothetical protein